MNSLKIKIALLAIVIGTSAAFVSNSSAHASTTGYWFDTNASGTPTNYDSDGPQCSDPSGDYCAKEYSASQLNFSGGEPVSVKSGQQNLQIASAYRSE